MRVLVSNDDGCQSAGIRALSKALEAIAEVTVVAPDRNRSGASNSLTLDVPIRATTLEDGTTCVSGTPTDCVHLAVTGLDKEAPPDMVVSGINHGPNLGDDVLYSGTVAAAMEGRFLGYPAIALSINSAQPRHLASAARAAVTLVRRVFDHPMGDDLLLNVNIPDRPWEEIAGFQVTRLGQRHQSEPVIAAHDPRGHTVYWVGSAGPEQDAGPGTDFFAVRSGFVSITPLQVDLTRHSALEATRAWLSDLG